MKGLGRRSARIGALVGAAAVMLSLTTPIAVAQSSQEPRLPRELWKTYPLDPSQAKAGEQSSGGGGTTTETGQGGTTTPAATREPAPAEEGGSATIALAAALAGSAAVVAIASALVFARRRGRLPAVAAVPPRRLAATASSVRLPPLRLPERLRSETGSLLALARRSAREEGEEAAGANPGPGHEGPPQKPLPGLAPPPAKEKQLRSGLPPGKTVPTPVEPPAKEQPARAAPAPASKPPPPAAAPRPAPRRQRVGAPRRPAPRTAALRAEECEIEWWRGYLKSDFYAFARRPDGTERVLARSPSFRWRSSNPPPREGRAAEAYDALMELLTAWGWEPLDNGGAWYRTRLRRRLRPSLRELAGQSG